MSGAARLVQPIEQTPSTYRQQVRFRGLNLYAPPQDVGADELLQADNVFIDGGEAVTRPGKQGMFATPLGSALYEPFPFLRADGTTVILFVSGGLLYQTTKGSSSYTEVQIGGATSFHLNSGNTRMWREGKYVYVVDGTLSVTDLAIESSNAKIVTSAANPFQTGDAGKTIQITAGTNFTPGLYTIASVDGSHKATLSAAAGSTSSTAGSATVNGLLYRVSLDSPTVAQAATGLSAPTSAPTNVSLTNTTQETPALGNYVGYGAVANPTTNLLTNGDFETVTISGPNYTPNSWTSFGTICNCVSVANSAGAVAAVYNGTYCLDLDVPGSGYYQQVAAPSYPSIPVGSAAAKARVYYFSMYGLQVTSTQPSVIVDIQALDGSGNILQTVTQVFQKPAADPSWTSWSLMEMVASFSNLTVDPTNIQVRLTSGPRVNGGSASYNNLLIDYVTLEAVDIHLTPATNTTSSLSVSLATPTNNTPASTSTTQPSSYLLGNALACVGNQWVRRDYVGTGILRTDLVIDGTNNKIVTSAAHQFVSGDVGKILVITAGTGFNVSGSGGNAYAYITAVDGSHKATLSAPAGTTSSTAGTGYVINTAQQYTDLAINSADLSIVTSAAHPFTAADLYQTIVISAGTNFTAGVYSITAVSSTGQATLSGNAGTVLGATGGTAAEVACGSYVANNYAMRFTTPSLLQGPVINNASQNPLYQLKLGFQQLGDSANTIYYTAPSQVDPSGQYFTFDVSTVPYAVRASAQYVYITFAYDLPPAAYTQLYTFGPIVQAGNLSVGYAPYTYYIAEMNDTAFTIAGVATNNTTDGQILSDPGPPSTPLIATAVTDQITQTLPVTANATTNKMAIYRAGGVFPDPIPTWRLVATVQLWSGGSMDATSPGLNYCTWNAATGVFVDNTPDSALFGVSTLITGRGTAPLGASCVTGWNGRLALSVGSTLYLSWLLNANNASGLYYNPINIPSDPYGPIKGIIQPVGANDGDTIQALIPMGQILVIVKTRSVWWLTGTDASNFTLLPHLIRAGVGLVAPRGYDLVEDLAWLTGSNAVWEYEGADNVNPMTVNIEKQLYPQNAGLSPIHPVAMKQIAVRYNGRRVYVFAPLMVQQYTDLVIGSDNTKLSSTARPFTSADVGRILNVTGGVGFTRTTTTPLTIISVSLGVATCAAAGTANSTGGIACLSDATNTCAWVFDTRPAMNGSTPVGWTRYLGMNVTSAASLSGSNDRDDFFLAGQDGQLYQLTPGSFGDIAVQGGSPAAVTITVKGKALGQETMAFQFSGQDWPATKRPEHAYCVFTMQETGTITLTAAATGTALTYTVGAHTVQSGQVGTMQRLRDRVRTDVRGFATELTATASTITQTRITAFGVEYAVGAVATAN